VYNRADMLVVHCTHFNRLMWDNGATPTRVIEHGVPEPRVAHTGELERGLVVVNNLARRGRRLGYDLYQQVKRKLPLDLVGVDSQELGEIRHADLPAFAARYRFFFNPIRHTSLGLALIEAMMLGMPVAALATTEVASVLRDGENGLADTNLERLVGGMARLLAEPAEARRLGDAGRRSARRRFGIARFVADWNTTFTEMTHEKRAA
jgi:glycosyltransferase involved in cell wall biosynthesis